MPDHPGIVRRIVLLDSTVAHPALLGALADEQGWVLAIEADYPGFLRALEKRPIDLVVVGITDVPISGEGLTGLVHSVSCPVLAVVTSGRQTRDALRFGATATVQSPYDPEVLILAMGALIRRTAALRTILVEATHLGDLTISLANHTVERDGKKRTLSATEWKIFAFLMANPGRIFGRRDLARGAWGSNYADRVAQIELYISRLRRKIERDPRRPEIIETIRGEGYRLRGQPTRTSTTGNHSHTGRRLPGENEDTRSASSVAYWRRAYSQLVDAKGYLIASARQDLDRLLPEVQREILSTDIRGMETDLSRLQRRLDYWVSRMLEAEESA